MLSFPLPSRVSAGLLLSLVSKQKTAKPWKQIHGVADQFLDEMQTLLEKAFHKGQKAIDADALRKAIEGKDHAGAEELLAPAITAIEAVLEKKLPGLLASILEESGAIAAKNLLKKLKGSRMRASAPATTQTDFAFDVTNPKAVAWIKEHATELISDISETTREELRDIILSAFEEERPIDEIIQDIYDIVQDATRAETIARTETMNAANAGQQELWDQALDEGLLTGTEKQVWIVTPDDRLCDTCAPMEGVEIALDGEFDVDGESIDGPPAHPNCRCTIGLSL